MWFILLIPDGEHVEMLAFIYPNDNTHPNYLSGRCSSDKEYDHTPFFVSVAEIEDGTGPTFFSDVGSLHLAHSKNSPTVALPYVSSDNEVGRYR